VGKVEKAGAVGLKPAGTALPEQDGSPGEADGPLGVVEDAYPVLDADPAADGHEAAPLRFGLPAGVGGPRLMPLLPDRECPVACRGHAEVVGRASAETQDVRGQVASRP